MSAAPLVEDPPAEQTDEPKCPASTRLLDYVAQERAEPWHDQDGDPYLSVVHKGARMSVRLPSTAARDWLSYLFYTHEGRAPSSQTLQEVLGVLQAQARFDGPCYPVSVRVLAHEDLTYVDLGTPDWSVVKVSASGWEVVPADAVPVRFWRPRGLQPLPMPVAGGDLGRLRRFVNTDDQGFCMMIAWITAAMSGRGPYPILGVNGEHGSAKSTATRVLRAQVDPASAGLRSPPREERDLYVGARNAHVVAYDNLSSVRPELSDALCRLATGGGFGTRAMYSNDEEAVFDAMRPIMMNGIPELAERPDLADRLVGVTLKRIPDEQRRDEHTFWAEFEQERPALLGALLNAVSTALRNWDSTHLSAPPRMADFARLIVAAEPALPWAAGAFMAHYAEARREAVTGTLEGDPVGVVVRNFSAHHPDGWQGTFTALLQELEQATVVGDRKPKGWPGNARALSGHLRRLAPALRAVGMTVEFKDIGRGDEKRSGIFLRPQPPQGEQANASNRAQSEENGGAATGGASPDGVATGLDGGASVRPGGATGAHGGAARNLRPAQDEADGGAGAANEQTLSDDDWVEL